jgi:hypothetical protein
VSDHCQHRLRGALALAPWASQQQTGLVFLIVVTPKEPRKVHLVDGFGNSRSHFSMMTMLLVSPVEMNLKKKGTKRATNIDRTGSLGRKRKLSTAEILSKLTRFAKKQ